MKHNSYLVIFITFLLALGVSQAQTKRPNILWISCEDISPRLGCYGDEIARTPNLDKLAEEGTCFDNVISTSPVCAPNRTGIITGMFPTTLGAHHMRTTHKAKGLPTPYNCVPPHYVKAFPEYLRKSGYYCTNNSKTDYQFGYVRTIWDDCSKEAHYKNRPNKDQPFFAVFNFTNTHESQNWEPGKHTDPNSVELPPYYPDTEKVRMSIARSYDNIHAMDSMAGDLLKELDALGLAKNTIVFFWSDHGDGMPRAKRWLYDSGTKIPLIVRWPGVTDPNSRNDELISTVDFAPTVLAMADVTIPLHMQGRVILGAKKAPAPEYVFSHRDRFDEAYDMVRSVRSKDYLFIRNFYPELPYIAWIPYRNRSPIMQELLRFQREEKLNDVQKLWMASARPAIEFYDLKNDPHQINNLANDYNYSEQINMMNNQLKKWQSSTKDLGEYSEEQMLNIWFKDGEQPVTSKPLIIPNNEEMPGSKSFEEGIVKLKAPAMIDFHCPTQGASITYSINNGEWKLYDGPIKLNAGETKIKTLACRYGYKDSDEAHFIIQLTE